MDARVVVSLLLLLLVIRENDGDGYWAHWSPWSKGAQPRDCGSSVMRRTRRCEYPSLTGNRGTACEGKNEEVKNSVCCTFNRDMCGYTPNTYWVRKMGAVKKDKRPDFFVGEYERDGTRNKNDWHYVKITFDQEKLYLWRNRANVTWALYPKSSDTLRVGKKCPYYNYGYKVANFNKDGVYGPSGEFYRGKQANVLSISIKENKADKITCADGLIVNITAAIYGESTKKCASTLSDGIVKKLCNGNHGCNLYASNTVFQDPCTGVLKELIVWYKCVPSRSGSYIYAQDGSTILRSPLTSPHFKGASGQRCFSFWYHMDPRENRKLILKKTLNAVESTIWTSPDPAPNDARPIRWRKQGVNFESTGPFRMSFSVEGKRSGEMVLALDDLFLHKKPCTW